MTTATQAVPEMSEAAVATGCLRIPLPAPISDEDVIRISDENPGWRVERGANGVLEAKVTASKLHTRVSFEIAGQLYLWNRAVGRIGVLCDSDGTYNLADAEGNTRSWAPDLSWISPERYEARTAADRDGHGFWNLCPDFVVEVGSPNESAEDRQARMEWWLRFGVRLAWLVDPWRRTVSIYRPGRDPEQLERPETLSGEGVLAEMEVDLRDIWQWSEEVSARPTTD